MTKVEEGGVGLDGALKVAATEVKSNHMTIGPVARDPLPRAAITTLIPEHHFRKRIRFTL